MRKVGLKQIVNSQFVDEIYNRSDIIVRYMMIEHYYGHNQSGLDLYNKMEFERSRGRSGGVFPPNDCAEKFLELIKSFEKLGEFNFNYPILCSPLLHLFDGAHRIACSLYFGCIEVSVKTTYPWNGQQIPDDIKNNPYGLENWFKHRFADAEISLIKNKQDEILFHYCTGDDDDQ